MIRRFAAPAVSLILSFAAVPLAADTATLAVAANLVPTAERMIAAFEAGQAHDIALVSGSSGRLYAQILAGAPFDLFLSADAERPAQLERDGLAQSRRTYALGRIVLVTAPGLLDGKPLDSLTGRRVAIADSALAPYGRAAEQALPRLGLPLSSLSLITGDSIGQVAGFFATGNVDVAVIALSLLPQVLEQRALEYQLVDPGLHDPIRQDGVLLSRGADNPAARAFWDWLTGSEATGILRDSGYEVPEQ